MVDEGFLAEVVLPGIPRSVSVARHCVSRVLIDAGHRNLDHVILAVSELVSNAVRHTVSGLAGGLITVDVREIGDAVARISVIDQGAKTVPQLCELKETDCTGRGLHIVQEISSRWGAEDDALGGRAVWAEVLTTGT
ncbi:ATP-binding protein [Nonomuraea sp. NPDC049486]|uniref:ATP-binding protein n=1 Tax=Nonomuraea sp. NPDC049486 TaxID=3155773 RepID=UPI00341BEC0C